MNLIYSHFTRFGLEMHISRDNQQSKTECVFFPSPKFLRDAVAEHGIALEAGARPERENTVSKRVREQRVDAEETSLYPLDSGGVLSKEQEKERASRSRKHESQKVRIECKNVIYDGLGETRPIAVDLGADIHEHDAAPPVWIRQVS